MEESARISVLKQYHSDQSPSAVLPFAPRDDLPAQRMVGRDSCRVLVVDDDALVRARLSALLNASEYHVEIAPTGKDALSVMRATPCQIVLTDWQMPDMDGLELCRHVRLAAHGHYVYILMLTVRDCEHDMLAGLAAGADAFLVKGATVDEILAHISIGRRISRADYLPEAAARRQRALHYTDPVTGAHDTRYFVQHLPREVARSQRYGHPLAILSCKIRGFRWLNGRSVHGAIDKWAREFAARCEYCIRQGDWIARTGSDEFMVVLPETAADGARYVAQKLDRLFTLQPPSTPADLFGFTVSVEVIAVVTRHDVDGVLRIEALLRAALDVGRVRDPLDGNESTVDVAGCVNRFDTPVGGQNGIN
jgi:diguanylate cyclase (GGDEF)-like protein